MTGYPDVVAAMFTKYKTKEANMTVLERPTAHKLSARSAEELEEYAQLASEAGVYAGDILIERLKRFLIDQDIPVFNLQEVTKYMDAKAKKDSSNNGWIWRPYRAQDSISRTFGSWDRSLTDYYHSNNCALYDKLIPLHALKKVVLIEKEFESKVALFVSDYAPKRDVVVDPFLMVVIPISSERLSAGEGRFVIDFWDEPGFGLSQQLK